MPQPASPLVISFDIDGTLIDFERLLAQALEVTAAQFETLFGKKFSPTDFQQLRAQVTVDPAFSHQKMEAIRRESFRRASNPTPSTPTCCLPSSA